MSFRHSAQNRLRPQLEPLEYRQLLTHGMERLCSLRASVTSTAACRIDEQLKLDVAGW